MKQKIKELRSKGVVIEDDKNNNEMFKVATASRVYAPFGCPPVVPVLVGGCECRCQVALQSHEVGVSIETRSLR